MQLTTNMNKSAFENHPHLPIAIVGGGLGGLALAIGLIRHGVKVHIYESSSAYSEIGAGLTFGTNATKALHLIDPRLLRGFMKHATFNDNPERDDTFCTVVWGTDEKRSGGRKAGDFAFHHEHKGHYEGELGGIGTKGRIHRARLLEEMVALLPEDITSFNKSFVEAQDTGRGMLQLSFADGTRALASAVIGCDGIKSKVRHHVCGPDVQPKYAGECAFRALVPGDEARAMLGEERALNCQLYSGYGAYIVTYPVEHGRFVNMIAIPQDELTGRVEQDTWTWTAPTSADEIRERFRSWYPPLIELIARHHLPSKWALYTVQHDSTYFKNRICLLGDSAHATTPHLGAGAGMSLEDAYILSHLVASAGSTTNIEAAFRAYDAVRRPRTQECVKRSLNVAQIYDLAFENVGDDMVKIKELLENNYNWLWDEDLEAQLLTAKNLLQSY